MSISHKGVHFIVATIAAAVGVAAFWFVPELRKDVPTTFGTATGIATLYGVVFAVVEVVRTRNAASLAYDAAKKVKLQFENLYGIKQLSDCQAAVDLAIASLDRGEHVPLPMLIQITKSYSLHFHAEMSDPGSEHRRNSAVLESYSAIPKGAKSGSQAKLRVALLSITRNLSTATGGRVGSEQ